ncbi:MAG: T9SS type A sorting domain-containing protein, partial [candidate division WOR-3 bacterium]
DLAPDSMVTIVFAVLFADWRTPVGGYIYLTPDSALALVDKWAEEYYDMYWFLYAPGVEENCSSAKPHVQLVIKPNPVFGSATVSFALSPATWVSLKLYNTVGQLVGEIMQGQRNGGTHIINLDTSRFAQGTYFLVLETPRGKTSRSLVILR